jgi:hypothetical protein
LSFNYLTVKNIMQIFIEVIKLLIRGRAGNLIIPASLSGGGEAYNPDPSPLHPFRKKQGRLRG